MSRINYTQADYGGEKTVFGVEIATIDAANFDTMIAAILALETAVQDVCIGAKIKREVILQSLGSLTAATDSEAQRELKWLVNYHDNGNPLRSLNIEIGCPDIIDATLMVAGTDMWDPTNADWIAFVAAFEAVVLAPYTGNNVTVDRVTLVGRRL
jgi:hypothetical protein